MSLTIANRPHFGVPILTLVVFGTLTIFFISYHLGKDDGHDQSPVGVGLYTVIYGCLLFSITVIGGLNIVDFAKGSYSVPPFVSEI